MESEIDVLLCVGNYLGFFCSRALGFPFIIPKRVPRRLMLMTLCVIILLHFKSDKVADERGDCCIFRRLWDSMVQFRQNG